MKDPDSGFALIFLTEEPEMKVERIANFDPSAYDFDIYPCSGSIILHHSAYRNDPAEETLTTRSLKLRPRDGYYNLNRILKSHRKLKQIETTGNCCWRFHTRPRFQGFSEYAHIGYFSSPSDTVRSIRKVPCTRYY